MSDFGVIQEQGFVTDDKQFGFTPIKETEANPFEVGVKETTKEKK